MAKTLSQILSKLDSPPAGHNFALCNFQERSRTKAALINLALGFPKVSYQWALKVIQFTLADKLSDAVAEELLGKNCPASQYDDNLEFLLAFLEYRNVRQFDGLPVFPEFSGHFMAGPAVSVPVRPTAILRENGVLKPLFIIPWANNRLKYYQRRLLASIYEDAICSLTDLRNSPGEVLIFPRNGYGKRVPDKWERNSYDLLSRGELTEQVERFILAREQARPEIAERFEHRKRQEAERKAALREAMARAKGQEPKRDI